VPHYKGFTTLNNPQIEAMERVRKVEEWRELFYDEPRISGSDAYIYEKDVESYREPFSVRVDSDGRVWERRWSRRGSYFDKDVTADYS
jgi:hypothetical protein